MNKNLVIKILLFFIFSIFIAFLIRCVFDSSGLRQPPLNYPYEGCAGTYYDFKFSAAFGQEPYTFVLTKSNALWLTLDKDGRLHGTPTQAGEFKIAVKVTDKNGKIYSREFIVKIKKIKITHSFYIYYIPGEKIDEPIKYCGGISPLTWQITSGSLPSGVQLTADGKISGMTTAKGTFLFKVRVEDSDTPTKNSDEKGLSLQDYKIKITSSSPLPDGQTSITYTTYQLTHWGGTGTVKWTNPDGLLPSGLQLSTDGKISGMPKYSGDFSFTVKVEDSATPPETDSKAFSLKIIPSPLLLLDPSSLPQATECLSYTYAFQPKGGTGKYSWKCLAPCQLPQGLSFNVIKGELSGTPEVPSSTASSFSIELSDSQKTVQRTFTLLVIEDPKKSPSTEITIVGVQQLLTEPVNTLSLTSLQTNSTQVRVGFKYAQASYLSWQTPEARLQVVGYCGEVKAAKITAGAGPTVDRVAHFDAWPVSNLLKSASITSGQKATLRFRVDVADGTVTKTFYQKIKVDIVN